jgi:hypothetical protein
MSDDDPNLDELIREGYVREAALLRRADAAEAEAERLRGIVRELLRFVPYEKPEQGPLPDWIVDVAQRARDAAGQA